MADLTDAQWAAAVAETVAQLIAGEITESQAAAEIAAATADWPTRTLSNADLAARVSRFLARLNGLILTDGPPDLSLGDLNAFVYDTANGALYGPKTAQGWGTPISLVGPEGKSAKAIVIAAGLLPADATDSQFATWLADSQKAAVQPLVDAATAARDAAFGSETAAEQAAAQAAADADATEADRLAVAGDKVDVAADRQATQDAAATATAKASEASGSAEDADTARLASEGARDASLAAQQASEAARDDAVDQVAIAAGHAAAADASADAAAADAVQTGADRTATGADRVASEAAAGIATGKAEEASLSALAAQEAEGGAETARDAAQAAQAAAEQARDEAEDIAGGNFLTEAQGDARYRLLSALLSIADVDGLAAALAGKVTPAQLDTAIQNIIGMAPADLDTLKEIADRLVGAEDDYAALVLVIAEKASQADLLALVGRVTTLEGRPQPVVTINGQSPDASGALSLQIDVNFDPQQALAAFEAALGA